MAKIREIKQRIKSIGNTAKVTHAMELVSAAKMRKGQEATFASRPYTNTLLEILSKVQKTSHKHPLTKKNNSDNHLVVVVTTDRGLVGGLNLNLFKEIALLENESQRNGESTKYIVIGKKGADFIVKSEYSLSARFTLAESSPYELSRVLSKMVIDSYTRAKVAKVTFVFSEFVSTVKQQPKRLQLLPIVLPKEEMKDSELQQEDESIFEPNTKEVLDSILPHFILTQIYQVLLEANASEQSARMVSMKNATDAAKDLTEELTFTYNQVRQEAVTSELLDAITASKSKR